MVGEMIPIEKAKGGERTVRRYKGLYEETKALLAQSEAKLETSKSTINFLRVVVANRDSANEALIENALFQTAKREVAEKRELRFRKKAAAANRHADELAREVKARGKALLRYRQGAETIISATHLANSTTTLHGRAAR